MAKEIVVNSGDIVYNIPDYRKLYSEGITEWNIKTVNYCNISPRERPCI